MLFGSARSKEVCMAGLSPNQPAPQEVTHRGWCLSTAIYILPEEEADLPV